MQLGHHHWSRVPNLPNLLWHHQFSQNRPSSLRPPPNLPSLFPQHVFCSNSNTRTHLLAQLRFLTRVHHINLACLFCCPILFFSWGVASTSTHTLKQIPKNVETAKCFPGVSFQTRNLHLESKDEKARKVLELADEICYLDSICNEILGGGFKYFYFDPYLGKITILTNIFQMGWNHQPEFVKDFFEPFKSRAFFGEFSMCCFVVVVLVVSWVCTMLKYMLVVYLVNNAFFCFYTMLTLYQAVRQGRNTVDSTGNLRYKNVGGRSVCIIYRGPP